MEEEVPKSTKSRKGKQYYSTSQRDDQQFGKFFVSQQRLVDDNLLDILRSKRRVKMKEYPLVHISEGMKNCFLRYFETKEIKNEDLEALTDVELSFLRKLIKRSKITDLKINQYTLNSKSAEKGGPHACVCKVGSKIDQIQHQLMINLGELEAGNNNESVKSETLYLLRELIKSNNITIAKAAEIASTFEL